MRHCAAAESLAGERIQTADRPVAGVVDIGNGCGSPDRDGPVEAGQEPRGRVGDRRCNERDPIGAVERCEQLAAETANASGSTTAMPRSTGT